MTIILDGNSAASIDVHGRTPSAHAFEVVSSPVATNTGGTTSDDVIGDATWRTYVGSTELTEAAINTTGQDVKFYSKDTAIATVGEDSGLVTRVSNGTARIVAKNDYYARRVNAVVNQVVQASSAAFLNYNSGTLAQACIDFVDAAVAGTVYGGAGNPQALFIGSDWNPDCWAIAAGALVYPINFSKDSVEPPNWGGSTAVHPRFSLICWHYENNYQPGRVLTWRTPDNVAVTRTVVAVTRAHSLADISVVQLDADLPESIGFARVLPDNWESYFASIYASVPAANYHYEVGIPIFRRNTSNRALTSDWYALSKQHGPSLASTAAAFNEGSVLNAERAQYFTVVQSGDSNNGLCLIHPDDLYLILLAPIAGGNAGTNVVEYKTEIEAIMDAAVPGATLTDADFSAYPSY